MMSTGTKVIGEINYPKNESTIQHNKINDKKKTHRGKISKRRIWLRIT